MIAKFPISKVASQIGARCLISFCVRAVATIDSDWELQTADFVLSQHLHSTGHRVFPLDALQQVEV